MLAFRSSLMRVLISFSDKGLPSPVNLVNIRTALKLMLPHSVVLVSATNDKETGARRSSIASLMNDSRCFSLSTPEIKFTPPLMDLARVRSVAFSSIKLEKSNPKQIAANLQFFYEFWQSSLSNVRIAVVTLVTVGVVIHCLFQR